MDILLIEDNALLRTVTVEFLSELGHQTVALADAERALAILSERTFDLVITDVSLPGMSGLAFAKQFVRRWPGIPLVVSSGYDEITAAVLHEAMGGEIVTLTKPYKIEHLSHVIYEATRFRI